MGAVTSVQHDGPAAEAVDAGLFRDVAAVDGFASPAAGPVSAADDLRVAQPALPALQRLLGPAANAFAHPAERELARLLSFYRVRWVYEPTTFALVWGADGRPTECFTPDFYLPDHAVYLELTTMRQRLVTRKNRKLRLLRELYPGVRAKLLYRRDYHRLLDAYPSRRSVGDGRPGAVVLSAEAIDRRVDELAADIAADASAKTSPPVAGPPVLLGVGRGSDRLLGALASALGSRGCAIERDRVDLPRYRPGAHSAICVRRLPRCDVAGRRVVVVEDVVSTGLSLAYLVAWLRRRGAASVDVCALLDRRAARLLDVPIRYAGFEAPDTLLAGWGLHLLREFRDLPHIVAVE